MIGAGEVVHLSPFYTSQETKLRGGLSLHWTPSGSKHDICLWYLPEINHTSRISSGFTYLPCFDICICICICREIHNTRLSPGLQISHALTFPFSLLPPPCGFKYFAQSRPFVNTFPILLLHISIFRYGEHFRQFHANIKRWIFLHSNIFKYEFWYGSTFDKLIF